MKDKKMFVLFTITLLVMALFTSMIRIDIKEVKKGNYFHSRTGNNRRKGYGKVW